MAKLHWLRKVLLTLVVIFCVHSFTAGQRDSLLKVLHQYPSDDTTKVNLLLNVAYTYFEKDLDSMSIFVSKAERLSQKLSYKKGLAQSYNSLGIFYYRSFKYRESFEYYNKALPLFRELGDTVRICKVYGNLRLIFEVFNDYSKQLEYSLKIDELAKKSKNPSLQIDAYLNLAFTYHSQDKHLTEIKYLENALHLSQILKKEPVIYDIMHYYGSVLKEVKRYPQALFYLNKALNYYETKDVLYFDQANCCSIIGLIYCEYSDKEKAAQYLSKSQNLAKRMNSPEIIAANFLGFSKIDSLNKNFKGALEKYQRYITLKEKLTVDQQNKQMVDLHVWYETEKNQKEKEQLKKEEQRQKALIQRQYQIIASLAIVLALVLLVVLMKLRHHRKTEALNLLLEKQKLLILEKNKDMEYLHKVKDKLFSVISHDLRSPVVGIQNVLTLLNNYQLSPEKFKALLDSVQEDVSETSHLLNNLLQWSRIQMKGKTPEKTMVDILPLIAETVRQFEVPAKIKRIKIQNRFSLGIHPICDAEMIKIVFRNLISNALKFSYPDNYVVIDGFIQDGFLVFSVKDSGMGILAEHQDKIFSLTESVGEKGTMLEASTGLGLILCHDFVVQNGGKIWFETEECKGTTFFFSLPLQIDAIT